MDREEAPEGERVLRARRIELVDADGRVRGVLGELDTPDPDQTVFGLTVSAGSGSPRVSMGVDEGSGWVVLDLGGNTLVQLGVNEAHGDAVDTRALLHLSDENGIPLIRWRVADDGSLLEERWH